MNRNKKILVVSILIILATTLVLMSACFDLSAPLGKINLDFDSEIEFENSIYAYTGEAIKPSVTVKHRDEVVDAKNYTLTYSDNVGVGKASVKAEGVGDYMGSVSATFDIGYKFTFDANGADNVDGDTTQIVISKDDIVPPTVEKAGYDFQHWTINSQPVDFDDVENLPSGGELVANFILKTFTVTYHLEVNTEDGNKVATNNPANKNSYTVENYFALKDATLSGMQFAGWYTDSEHKNRITSIEGYAQNLNLYAKFAEYTDRTIEYRVPNGANAIATEFFKPETNIEYLNSQYAQEKEIDGVTKQLVWYADSNYTTRYFFREMPDADIVVYAQWEEVLRAGFLDKVDEFNSNNVSIDSFEELVAYIDYVCFNNIVSSVQNKVPIDVDFVKITYVTERSAIGAETEKALIATTFPRMAPITYEFQGGTQYGSFRIALTKDLVGNEATKSATAKEEFLEQLGNIFSLQSTGRADNYDKFPIDYVEKTFEVETSNQLFYVLSHGYRPLPKSGSRAEIIYNYFRNVMRDICDDSMSDLEKTRAIFEWIILQVQYDYAVANPKAGTELADSEKTYLYDAFYLEGVLRGSAVCDGISKAYSVMCAIEGIDCVRVTGEIVGERVGHAWNKVKIGGVWYLTDATWGNLLKSDSGYEFISYEYFLFTDEVREQIDGYGKQNYTYYIADTEFDNKAYYSSRKIVISGHTADLYIDSDTELSYLLDYIDVLYRDRLNDLAGFSFEIMISPNVVINDGSADGSTASRLYYNALSILNERRLRGLTNRAKISVKNGFTYDMTNENGYIRAVYIF